MKMHVLPKRLEFAALLAPLLALGACGADSIGGPDSDPTGAIRVTVQTAAATAEASLDTDGYIVSVHDFDFEGRPVEPNGELTFTGIPPGEHFVDLQGLEVNCTSPTTSVRATVVAGGTAQVSFQVTCWPPTTGRIVFTRDDDIYSMNADGTDLVPLTTLGGAFWPAWSPDGSKIAFAFNGANAYLGIYVINTDGSGLAQLTSHLLREVTPSWSPDGSRIAFARNTTTDWGPADIYVTDADGGGNEVQLTSDPANDPADDAQPAWSPDGSKIAFTTDRDGNTEVYVMNADGSDPVNLTNNPADDGIYVGAWSPDGTQIVFNSNRDGNGELYVMNADGSDPVNLTNSPYQEVMGAWSPDGTKIAFRQGPDPVDIFIINEDGTGMVDITNRGETLDRFPHWSHGTAVLSSTARSAPRPAPGGSR